MVGLFLGCLSLESCSWLRSGGLKNFLNSQFFSAHPSKKKKNKSLFKHQKKSCQKVEQKTSGASASPLIPVGAKARAGGVRFVSSLWVTYQYLLFIQGDFTDALPWGPAGSLPMAVVVAGWGSVFGGPHPRNNAMLPVGPGMVQGWGSP